MIEYIRDIIRATSGEVITIGAILKDDGFTVIDGECYLVLYDDAAEIDRVKGTYNTNKQEWDFVLDTNNLKGKYYYNIYKGETSLSFKQPIYLV